MCQSFGFTLSFLVSRHSFLQYPTHTQTHTGYKLYSYRPILRKKKLNGAKEAIEFFSKMDLGQSNSHWPDWRLKNVDEQRAERVELFVTLLCLVFLLSIESSHKKRKEKHVWRIEEEKPPPRWRRRNWKMNGKWPWMMSQYTKQKVVVFFFNDHVSSLLRDGCGTLSLFDIPERQTQVQKEKCARPSEIVSRQSPWPQSFFYFISQLLVCVNSRWLHIHVVPASQAVHIQRFWRKKKKARDCLNSNSNSKMIRCKKRVGPAFSSSLSFLFFCFAIFKLDVNWRFDPDSMYASSKCQRYRFRTPLCVCRPFHYTQHSDIGL